MKKCRAFLLLLALLIPAGAPALAAEPTLTFTARSADLNRYNGHILCRMENAAYYSLLDADGNVLVPESEEYTYMSATEYGYIKVERAAADGLHDEGLLDGDGKVLIPAEYADIDIVSSRWQLGIKLAPSSAEDKDYTVRTNDGNTFYRIDTTDFYFDGRKVGSLSRADFGGGYCTAYGAYIRVPNIAKENVYYNSKLEPSPYGKDFYGEYDQQYYNRAYTYYHIGSGQQAFAASCTLNAADVEDPYLYSDGAVYDLQGNLLFNTLQNYDSIRDFKGGYAVVYKDRMYGMIDLTGKEAVPLKYSSVGYSESEPFKYGYISAERDGKFGFVDVNGQESCDFTYSKDIVSNRSTFGTLKNLDGSIIVISAAVGELPQHYSDVSFPGYYGCMVFEGKNDQGQTALIDLYGNTLLPFDTYNSLDATHDGSVALVYHGNRQYDVFRFDITGPVNQPVQRPAEEPVREPAAQDDGTWICANGHGGNTGNFCSECGSPRPAEETQPTHCANCGFEFGETVPKFCPNCGTKTE